MIDRVKLLYVEDEPINRKLFQLIFDKDYEVLTAEEGVQGLSVLEKEQDITVVISDMNMPIMNGITFINKAKEKFPEKKFYILTAYMISEEIQSALATGLILKCFGKPFNRNEIVAAIEQDINSNSLEKNNLSNN
ncbi:response regulator [Solitalea koreensis]|uniref:CheY chemotaxis protein or a CheY-like REC (Receiver) domain n=1 Tax=Solitalea koreensis TaxID=543615 RepID=A0A521ADI4_9SPHI|nr:response regulator [Solitalea koreensis]SMO32873.1 CheY chemotaxis protein or a CheY-like REC (receiver) domain [Solitalea koreensis]